MKRTLFLIAIACLSIKAMAGQGYYIEYKMIAGEQKIEGTLKTYTLDGNNRSEMEMTLPGMGANTMVNITKKDSPDTVYTINEKNKTYSKTSYGKKKDADQDYEITVLGPEKVNGYNCVHIRVLYKALGRTAELWTSKDIKDYASFANAKNKYMDGAKFYKAMEAKGAAGFPVRITSSEGKGQMTMDLVKAEKQNIDPKLFSLDGYKETTAMSPVDRQEMMKKIQAMTPEERQKYMQEMREKMQQHAQQPK